MKRFVIFVSAFLFAFGLPLAARPSGDEDIPAASFNSTGVLVNGWHWLADLSHTHIVEWRFSRLPENQDIAVRLEALYRPPVRVAEGGVAEFYLFYGAAVPGAADVPFFGRLKAALPGVPGGGDPNGLLCRGEVVIPRGELKGNETLVLRASRVDAVGEFPAVDHILGFKAESAVLVAKAAPKPPVEKPKIKKGPIPQPIPTDPVVPKPEPKREPVVPAPPKPEPKLRPFDGEHLPNSDSMAEAYLLKPGAYYGDMGAERRDGSRDNVDWYAVNVRRGDILVVTLDMKEGRNFNLALVGRNGNPLETSARTKDLVDMVEWAASQDGPVYIKIYRAAGQGRFSLGIDTRHQDDAKSGRDAGPDQESAVPIYPTTEPSDGQLLADDNIDVYSIGLEQGWELRVKLMVQSHQNFNLALIRPDGTIVDSSREGVGESEQIVFKAQAARTFYLRVIRKSGEGHYKLDLNIHK